MRDIALALALLLLVGPAAAQTTVDEQVPVPVPEVIELPAGVSLISAPLDAGTGLARDAFGAIEPEWPLFFGWDAAAQEFTEPEDSMLSMGAGFWYWAPAPTTLLVAGQPYRSITHHTMLSMGAGFWYWAPAPTTLLVAGQPYRSITHHTRDTYPGWHLFGVPYSQGVGWTGLRLYASGNPVGLETAEELGWVRMPVLSQWGSAWQALEPGQPFEPGHAYWLRTTVPLSVRLEPGPTSMEDAGTSVREVAANVGDGQANVSTEAIGLVGETLQGMAEVAALVAEGNYVAAAAKGIGVILCLSHDGLSQPDDGLAEKLTALDTKMDRLLDEMEAISSQLANLENQVEIVKDTIAVNRLNDKVEAADLWLDSFYNNPKLAAKTLTWARWAMADCNTAADVCRNATTVSSLNKFRELWYRSPFKLGDAKDKLADPSNDFLVSWSYSVLGYYELAPYKAGGMDAHQIVRALHNTMIEDPTTNPLMAFQDRLFREGQCFGDTTATACDLYTDVYLPLEAYFQKVVAAQTALVEALVEAASVRAQVDPDHFANDPKAILSDFNDQLAAEAEIFVRTAEQIALYRAADGRFDWSSFDTTDAAQLLARADFVAMRLIGHAYDPNRDKPELNPPWPEKGVVGRIFYSVDEPTSTTTRGVCAYPNVWMCTDLLEAPKTLREVTGSWPYLVWTASGDTAIGTPSRKWRVRRLQPQELPVGGYIVISAVPARGWAGLVVAYYDDSYLADSGKLNPTGKRVLPFGSFVGLEGKLGTWALASPRTTWKMSGNTSNDLYRLVQSGTDTGATVRVTFEDSGYFLRNKIDWSDLAQVSLQESSTSPAFSEFTHIRVSWPSVLTAKLHASPSSDHWQWGDHTPNYFRTFQQELGLVDSDGNLVQNGSLVSRPCGGSPFNDCDKSWGMGGPGTWTSKHLFVTPGKTYTLRATYSGEVWSGDLDLPWWQWHYTPSGDSMVLWQPLNPVITLVR